MTYLAKFNRDGSRKYTNRETGKFMTVTQSPIDHVTRLYRSDGHLAYQALDRAKVFAILEDHLAH